MERLWSVGKKNNDKIDFDIKIPPNTEATFIYKDKLESLKPGKYQFSVENN